MSQEPRIETSERDRRCDALEDTLLIHSEVFFLLRQRRASFSELEGDSLLARGCVLSARSDRLRLGIRGAATLIAVEVTDTNPH